MQAHGRFLRELKDPGQALRNIGPNWFTMVMGTGIVANAAVLLPHQLPQQRAFALLVWLLAVALSAIMIVLTVLHWMRHPRQARAHVSDPAVAPFYGAPPMALLTVGAGALLVGRDLIGLDAAVALDLGLWSLGTLGGLVTAVTIPVLMFARYDLEPSRTLPTWLLPLVPPMVSAATGAALIPHLPDAAAQQAMLLACYAMFGLSLIASLIMIGLVWARLIYHSPGALPTAPTLWIVLGPLGQSITATGLLGAQAQGLLAEPYARGLEAMGVLYGIPVWGFAMLWLAIAVTLTVRAIRRHLAFALTWWSFTFPVGTVVTGTSVLAAQTGSEPLAWAAAATYLLLLGAWVTCLANTLRGAWSGAVFRLPATNPTQ